MSNTLPPQAERLIREAVKQLAASRRLLKLIQVADARALLENVLREYGTPLASPPTVPPAL